MGTFKKSLLKKDLIVQNFEATKYPYQELSKQAIEYLSYFPDEMKEYVHNYGRIGEYSAINAGILGGNNIQFFKDFTGKAFKIIDQNYKDLRKIDLGWFNLFYEQSLFIASH